MKPFASRPPQSVAHAVRRAVLTSAATVVVGAASFGAVTLGLTVHAFCR
jgi:hypothetical protein